MERERRLPPERHFPATEVPFERKTVTLVDIRRIVVVVPGENGEAVAPAIGIVEIGIGDYAIGVPFKRVVSIVKSDSSDAADGGPQEIELVIPLEIAELPAA
jgi:hypothetical protein